MREFCTAIKEFCKSATDQLKELIKVNNEAIEIENKVIEDLINLRKHTLIDKNGNFRGIILPEGAIQINPEDKCKVSKLYKGGWIVYPPHYYYKDIMREDEKVDYSPYTIVPEVVECANNTTAVFFGSRADIEATPENKLYTYVFDNYAYFAKQDDMSERDFVHYINKYNLSV